MTQQDVRYCFYEFQDENREDACLQSYSDMPEGKAEESCPEIPEEELLSSRVDFPEERVEKYYPASKTGEI
jgi:hypothetical protein